MATMTNVRIRSILNNVADLVGLDHGAVDVWMRLTGGAGNDILSGGAGNDILSGLGGSDLLGGFAGDDVLLGGSQDDVLRGGPGNDHLNGEYGADAMTGGQGNDVYWVSNPWDMINESPGEGIDQVFSDTSRALTLNVENLILTGFGAVFATGNDLDNQLHGNAIDNTLIGGGGNDSLFGGKGEDTLRGGPGNDTLDGGADSDIMLGGPGDDVYYMTQQDYVNEAAGEGIDWVVSSREETDLTRLGAMENLRMLPGCRFGIANNESNLILGNDADNIIAAGGDPGIGDGNDTFLGYGGDDDLYAGVGNDTLDGGRGDDFLMGGEGLDTMTGGWGDDKFYFDSTTTSPIATPDRITDFRAGGTIDEIFLAGIDANTGKVGNQAFAFNAFPGATLGSFAVVYSHVGGDTLIRGDVNGDATADFAIMLTGNLNLTWSDFIL